jgi:hypothetical protein
VVFIRFKIPDEYWATTSQQDRLKQQLIVLRVSHKLKTSRDCRTELLKDEQALYAHK